MKKLFEKVFIKWLFVFRNPVVRKGEHGGFKWVFRRFWLEIETVSGNFKARFIASEHPYGFLVAGTTDDNIEGYCETIYSIATLLTTDKGFVSDVNKAVQKYLKRLEKEKVEREDDDIALEEVKLVQEHVELPEKERRKVEKDIDKRFRRAVKAVKKEKKDAAE